MSGQHAAPAVNPLDADPVGSVIDRINHVRANPIWNVTETKVTCYPCGPLLSERGQGVASHAVAHPGHVVTVITMNTVSYQDKREGRICATEHQG